MRTKYKLGNVTITIEKPEDLEVTIAMGYHLYYNALDIKRINRRLEFADIYESERKKLDQIKVLNIVRNKGYVKIEVKDNISIYNCK